MFLETFRVLKELSRSSIKFIYITLDYSLRIIIVDIKIK